MAPLPQAAAEAPPTPAAIALALGLDAEGAEVVRAASRHVVRFPASAVRAFLVPAGSSGPRDEAAVASLLADAGVPAARRLYGPASVDGWSVTAWREIPPPDGPVQGSIGPAVLGALAHRLHRATAGLDPRGLVPCDPLGAALAQLGLAVEAGATSEAEVGLLRGEVTRLEAAWSAAVEAARRGDLPASIVHGDLHADNVVAGRDGPVLVDLELAGWGPCALDAGPTVAAVRWYGRPPADLTDFDTAYGRPLTEEAGDRGLDEIWAVWSTAWAVANRHRSDEAEDEAAVRLATWAEGVAPRPWRLS